jgi:uncharacterized protein YndB with AHSA1/START domain
MGHIRESIHVDAPIEQVWELGAKCDRYTEWQTGIVEVKGCTGPMDHVGATYAAVYKAMGRNLEVTVEVTRSEKPRVIENKLTVPGGGHGTSLQTAEPAGAARTSRSLSTTSFQVGSSAAWPTNSSWSAPSSATSATGTRTSRRSARPRRRSRPEVRFLGRRLAGAAGAAPQRVVRPEHPRDVQRCSCGHPINHHDQRKLHRPGRRLRRARDCGHVRHHDYGRLLEWTQHIDRGQHPDPLVNPAS